MSTGGLNTFPEGLPLSDHDDDDDHHVFVEMRLLQDLHFQSMAPQAAPPRWRRANAAKHPRHATLSRIAREMACVVAGSCTAERLDREMLTSCFVPVATSDMTILGVGQVYQRVSPEFMLDIDNFISKAEYQEKGQQRRESQRSIYSHRLFHSSPGSEETSFTSRHYSEP